MTSTTWQWWLLGYFAAVASRQQWQRPRKATTKIPALPGLQMIDLRSTVRRFLVSFHRFYEEVYLPDHAAPLNRWVHFLSNLSALLFLVLAILYSSLYFLAVGIFCQLGPPYFGHLLFEKTHRSIDQSPIFAAMGSWYTTFQIFLGKQSVTYGVGRRGDPKKAAKECDELATPSVTPSEGVADNAGQLPQASGPSHGEKDEAR